MDRELLDAAARTAELLRAVTDPAAPVPGLSWTVADTAAHLVGELADYRDAVAGAPVPASHPTVAEPGAGRRNATANAEQLTRVHERDLHKLADQLVPTAEEFLTAAADRRAGERFLASNGVAMSVPLMTSALLGEQLIHGLDIARAAKRPWAIDPGQALLVATGLMEMLADYVDHDKVAGRSLSYELRFRGGDRYRMAIANGTATVTPAGQPVDCWISADPVAFLLVGFGRTPQWGPILRGKIVAGGRRPWRALAFADLLTAP
jgi:hypothetical protein